MTLPFLVVHGAVVWKIALGVVTGTLLGGVALLRRRNTRAAARAAVAELERRTDPGVVRGVLGGGAAQTLIAQPKLEPRAAFDHRGDELWIETAEGKVMLDGAIRVLAGSHAAAARNGVPAETPDALVSADASLHRKRAPWSATLATATLAKVSPGDEVIAFGQLDTVAGRDETDNRTNASARVLRPLPDAPISLAAQRPRAAVPRMSVVLFAVIAGVTPLIGWKIEAALGEAWRRSCWDAKEGDGDAAAEIPHACALASAMPGSRENALDRIQMLVERDPYRDRATIERLVELSKLTGDCSTTLGALDHAERYDQLLTVARECGDRRAEHLALLDLGRFEEAVAVTVPAVSNEAGNLAALPTPATLILAGRWTDAAVAADRRAEAIRSGEHKPDEQRAVDLTALSYRCLAELLRYDGGDTAALGRLRALAAGENGAVCAPALVDIVPESERAALLATRDVPLLDSDVLLHKLRGFAGGAGVSFETVTPEAMLSQPDDLGPASEGVSVWLAETAPPLPADAPAQPRANLDRWQAVAAVLAGDIPAARERAARALATAPRDEENRYQFRYLDTLPAAIALYTNDPVTYTIPAMGTDHAVDRELWLHDFGRLLLRRGEPLVKGTYFGPDGKYVAALAEAAQGDGRALARRMGGRDLTWWTDTDVMAVLPRVKVGREAIARQLAWSTPENQLRLEFHFPWSVALHAAARRSALQLAGVTDEAARWAEIYKRYDQAFRDRKKLIALALWDL